MEPRGRKNAAGDWLRMEILDRGVSAGLIFMAFAGFAVVVFRSSRIEAQPPVPRCRNGSIPDRGPIRGAPAVPGHLPGAAPADRCDLDPGITGRALGRGCHRTRPCEARLRLHPCPARQSRGGLSCGGGQR